MGRYHPPIPHSDEFQIKSLALTFAYLPQDLLSEVTLTAASKWSEIEPLLEGDQRYESLSAGEGRRFFEAAVASLSREAATLGEWFCSMLCLWLAMIRDKFVSCRVLKGGGRGGGLCKWQCMEVLLRN